MLQVLFLLIIVDILNAVLYVDTGPTKRPQSEFETVLTDVKEKEKIINCEDFSQYSRNCTSDAALIAIKHLTTCAMDWNVDCKGQTDSYFNEESIKGHIHVANNICDDDLFFCTLNTIFRSPSNCTHDQAVTLQKFSVIVSEGAVYQIRGLRSTC
ncbi:unnamed protein product [Leptidea sinapis]|uniref:Uncharacterized protein n=1 Tax=Leptidea sinapis TaxID=189913 RepID=A0A5E4QSS7_9NEOP|nr:unnamed protein product [Leptidea sinapis]